MAISTSKPRVVVVGGGIFGVSTAVNLAEQGAGVTLVTEGVPASGASGRSLSWLNSARARSAEYHRLRMVGLDRYRTLAAAHPDVSWLRFDGGLTWDADTVSNQIADVFAYEQSIDYPAQFLSGDQVAAVTPGVNTKAIPSQGAIFNPDEGWVDLPSLIGFLLERFASLGGKLATDAGKATIEVANARVTGARTADGQFYEADAALLAVGAAVPKVVAELGYTIPDQTPIGLLIRTRPLHHPLRAVLNTPRAAIRPTPYGTFVLDSGWAEREVVVHGDGSYEAKESTIAGLLKEASAVLEGNPNLVMDSFGMGPKPIPGGGDPVLGGLGGISGYHIAFSHSGATLGLIAGEILAREIITGELDPLLAAFRPGRFA